MTAKAVIEEHFSRTAPVWRDRIYKAKPQQKLWEYFDKQYRFDYVVEMITSLPKGRGKRALDIGCGAGQLIPVLSAFGYDVEANDISANMVEMARTVAKQNGVPAKVEVGDCENLNNSDSSLDLVV